MAEQISIEFPEAADFSAPSLVPHPGINLAMQWLHQFPDWPTATMLLVGPEACGKSHLAAACLPADCPSPKLHLWDMSQDPVETPAQAEALFHLINHCQSEGERLLVLSRQAVADIYPALPDLDSRLRAATIVPIGEPETQEQWLAIFMKMCADAQLSLELDTATYILTRAPRRLASLQQFCRLAAQDFARHLITKASARPLIEKLEDLFAERQT